MHEPERDRSPSIPEVDELTEEGPALRDASATARRVADDEAAAAGARERLIGAPLASIEPDDRIGPNLQPGELVHDLHRHAILNAPMTTARSGMGAPCI